MLRKRPSLKDGQFLVSSFRITLICTHPAVSVLNRTAQQYNLAERGRNFFQGLQLACTLGLSPCSLNLLQLSCNNKDLKIINVFAPIIFFTI